MITIVIRFREFEYTADLDNRVVLIGRPGNAQPDLDLSFDGSVSRAHAKLFVNDDGIWINDLGSKWGTYVDGKRISAAVQLSAESSIRMGETEIAVRPTSMQPSSPADSNKTLEELRKENPVRSNSETSDLTYTAQLAPEIELHSESATKDLEPSHDAPPHEETTKKNSRWKSLIKFILLFFAVTLVYIGIKSLFSGPKVLYPVYGENGEIGFIDSAGNLIVPIRYTPVLRPIFNDGLVAVTDQGKVGFLDDAGKLAIPFKFNDISRSHFSIFNEGLCPISENGKVGYINKQGEFVIPPQFDEALPFINGYAAVQLGEKLGLIDREGKYVANPQFDGIDDDMVMYLNLKPEGLPAFKMGEKYGFIDETGKFFINPQFDKAFYFTDGLAVVENDNKWGFIGDDGKYVIEAQFENAAPFTDGYAAVEQGGKWGFIGKDGKYIINPQYERAFPFKNGVAPVRKDEKWKFITQDGSDAWDKEYNLIYQMGWILSPPETKLVMVTDEKGPCYINLKGEVVYRFPQRKK